MKPKKNTELLKARRILGFSQKRMANEIGVGIAIYGYWERGEADPPVYIKNHIKLTMAKLSKDHPHHTGKEWTTEEIRDLFEATGMTDIALAEFLGITRQTVWAWRKGKRPGLAMHGKLDELQVWLNKMVASGKN